MKITKKLQKEVKAWIDQLRSGKFSQGTGQLQSSAGFCCLGVACKVLIPNEKVKFAIEYDTTYDDDEGFESDLMSGELPDAQEHAPDWLKNINDDFCSRTGKSLDELNDHGPVSKPLGKSNPLTSDENADLLQLVYIEKVDMRETEEVE